MTEATAALVVEMRVRDLFTKALQTSTKNLTKFRKVGTSTFKSLGRSVATFGKVGLSAITSFVNSARKRLLSLGKITILGGTAASLGFGASFAKEAIDFEETASKFRAVFKDLAASAVDDLKRINRETGVSQVELTGYLSTLQDTFVPLGVAINDAAKLSSKVTQLGIDLASFNNRSTGDVLADLQSALVGNTETVRKYGIVITEAGLKQEAYRLGLTKVGAELSEQVKLQARLSLLFKGSIDAQGDAAATLDSTANVFKRLRSNFTELKVIFGREIVQNIRNVIDELGGVEGVTQKIALGFGLLTRSTNTLVDALGKVAGAGSSLFGELQRTDGVTSLLSGRFARIQKESVSAAEGVEFALSALTGAKFDGLSSAINEDFDSIPDELQRKLGVRLRVALDAVARIALEGAKVIGGNIKLGIIEALDGFTFGTNSRFLPDISIDLSDQTKAVEADLREASRRLDAGFSLFRANYTQLTRDIQKAGDDATALVGPSSDEILKQLVPSPISKERAAAEYADLGALFTTRFNSNFKPEATFENVVIGNAAIGAAAQIGAQFADQYNAAIAAVGVGQRALIDLVSNPGAILAFGEAGKNTIKAYEDAAIEQLSSGRLPTRVEEYFAAHERQIAELAARQIRSEGGRIVDQDGNATREYVELIRQLRAEFQASGSAASGAFAAGVRDAVTELSNLSDQAANAGQDLVRGFHGSLSDSFNDFITKAKSAGDAWDAFRDRFKQVLAKLVSDLLASGIIKLLASLFGGPNSSEKLALNAALGGFGFSFAQGGVMSGRMGSPIPVKAYAQGGIASTPQLALFGEGRGKEAFVPLPNSGKIPVELNGSQGTTANITFNITSLDPRGAAEVIIGQRDVIMNSVAEALNNGSHRGIRSAVQGVR